MVEPYFNTSFGLGLEGFLNYSNSLTDGWFANAFLAMIWIVIVYTLGKSEWKVAGSVSFAFFVTFIAAMIMKLFMNVSEYTIFLIVIGLAGSIFWSFVTEKT